MNIWKKTVLATSVASLGLLGGCFSNDDKPNDNLATADAVVLLDDNVLLGFDRTAPGTSLGTSALSGFQASDEVIIGIDFRPFNAKLYAITKDASNVGRAYTVDLTNGQLQFIAQLQADPADAITTSAPYSGITGNKFGVDFNPAADALRVVSDAGQNLRIFLDSDRRGKTPGFTFTDGDLSAGTATAGFAATGAAYTNSFDGTSSTRLFDIDTNNNRLLQQDANPGVLADAGPLGVDATESNGFDIDPETNLGYAVLDVNGAKSLYTIRIPGSGETLPLTASLATKVGDLPTSQSIKGLAIRPNANPVVTGLTGSATSPSLVSFSVRNPNTITATTAVSGLSAGDQLLSIDYRPATGELFGLVRNGTAGKLVTINPSTGAATTLASLVDRSSPTTAIVLDANKAYNIDFNPAADALRVVSTSAGGTGGNGENLRVVVKVSGANNPGYTFIEANEGGGNLSADTGTAANFNVALVGYSDSYSSTVRPQDAGTKLFDIDSNNSALLRQNSANAGLLQTVGPLGVTVDAFGGFDITGGDNGSRLLAARQTGNTAFSLYNVNLTTGAASAAGNLTSGDALIGGASGPADLRDITIRFNGIK